VKSLGPKDQGRHRRKGSYAVPGLEDHKDIAACPASPVVGEGAQVMVFHLAGTKHSSKSARQAQAITFYSS
jgi:hypothetical protein